MHEILTLQFGHFTNFIGTHFWNTQDSYFSYDLENAHEPGILHDVLYRSGITQKGIETYMPRLLVYDLKGGFGSIRKMNKLYEEDLSDNKEEIQQNQICLEIEEEAIINSTKDPNMMEIDFEEKYFDLDESVKMWSDFNKIYYHPKSINRVTQYQYDDEFMPFDVFSFGKNAYLDHQKEDENSFDENFRFFAEECDLIQGFQIITNLNDGFGGFSCGFVEQLIEEYPKKSVLTFGINETLIKSSNHSHYIKNNLNTILSLIQLTDMSSMFIPMNEPSNNILNNSEWNKFIHPNLDLSYHSSSIMSAVIESTILPFRTRNNFMSMDSFIDKMNWLRNTKIGSLGAVFPLPISIHPAIFVENWPEPYCSIISGGFFFVTVTNIFMVGVIALMSWLVVCVGIQQPNYGRFDYKLFIVPIGSAICSTIVARPTFRSDEFWCYTSDEFTTIPKFLLAIDFIILVLTLFCYVSIIVRINSAELNNTNRSFLIASRKIVGYLTMYIIQWTPLMSYVIADILDQEYASVFFISVNFIAFGGILNMIQYVINEGWVNENKSGLSSLSSSTELTASNDNNIIIRVHVQNQNNDTMVDDDLSSIDNKNK
ncbi:7112_t:CDS:10 [Entrophospora sp. SA101]|nr:7112_t:CDS:10 [Entrophospora sp. SA101]